MTDDPLASLEATLDTLWSSHRHDLIIDTAQRLLAIQPSHRNALVALIRAYYDSGKYDLMFQTNKRALDMYPNDPTFYYLLYLYYLYQGGEQYLLAKDNILKAIELDPQNASYFRNLGEIYLINREPDKAIKYLRQAVTLSPGQAEYRSRLALALLRDHQKDQALAMARQALEQDPANPQLLDTVGMIYILVGQLDQAENFFRDALRQNPTHSYFQDHLAWIEREKKDFQARQQRNLAYTPLYLRQKGTKRFFDEDRLS